MAKKMNFTRRNRAKRTIENVGFMQIKDAAAGGVELYIYGDIVSSEWDKWTPEDTCPQDITDFLNGSRNTEARDGYSSTRSTRHELLLMSEHSATAHDVEIHITEASQPLALVNAQRGEVALSTERDRRIRVPL